MSIYMVNKPVTIARGRFTVPAGNGSIGPPGSGATITLYNSLTDWAGDSLSIPNGPPFSRVVLSMNSSADSGASGVVFSEALDGLNFDSTATFSYTTVSGLTAFDFLVRSPGAHLKLAYTNSAAVLTVWRFVLTGILGDRNPGA